MRLIKLQDGLVEQDNYFLTSPSSDFLGENEYSRSNDIFTLKGGYIERPFKHDNFVIIVRKKQVVMDIDDEVSFYLRKDNLKSGVIETSDLSLPSSKYWKLTRYKEYVQGYSSEEGSTWKSVGGGGIMPLQDVQGFNVTNSSTNLQIQDYKVYSSPYTKVVGLDEGNVGVLTDVSEDIVDEKVVDVSGELNLYLENVVKGRLTIYEDSDKSSILYESDETLFQFGDIFNVISHELALFYKSAMLDEKSTLLNSLVEATMLKNLSLTETYTDVLVGTTTDGTDTIELSLDNASYSDELIIDKIVPNEEVDIYIKITKDSSVHSFKRRHFDLIIDV